MAKIREAEIKCPFICLVSNTVGMYWGKVRAEGDKPNQKAWRIAYIPLKHAKKSFISATVSNISPKRYVELTKVKYPDSGVEWPFSPENEPQWENQSGRFTQVCIAYEDTNGNSNVLSRLEEMNLKKNSELERELNEIKKQLSHEEIEKLELEHKADETDDHKRGRQRTRDETWTTEETLEESEEGWDNL